jgi:predicted  nucleic acid-binding Zn-ribbon protein
MSKEQDVLNSFIKIASTGKDLETLSSELESKKMEKAKIEREIGVVRNSLDELNSKYASLENEKKEEVARLDKVISDLNIFKDNLTNSAIIERTELNFLRDNHFNIENQLKIKASELEAKEKNVDRDRVEVNNKISIINQIIGLAEGL